MRSLFLLLLFSINLLCYSQGSNGSMFKGKKADTLETKLKDFIILGVSSAGSQLFLDNLSDKMIKEFKRQHVNVEYRWIGKTVDQARQDTNLNYAKKFSAVLLFLPSDKDTSFEVYTYREFIYSPFPAYGPIGGRTYTAVANYDESYEVKLYTQTPANKLIWAATLKVDHMLNKRTYKIITNSFIKRFRRHEYIE